MATRRQRPRRLYAYVSAAGHVLGGAPFDATSLREARAEVAATFSMMRGDRVVRATDAHLDAYERQDVERYYESLKARDRAAASASGKGRRA